MIFLNSLLTLTLSKSDWFTECLTKDQYWGKNGPKVQTFNGSLAISGFSHKRETLKCDPSKHVLPVAEFAPSPSAATHVTLRIEITLLIIFTGQHETAVLSEVKVIHKQKGPITFMTPHANFTTFALEHGTKPQTVSELPGGGSRVTPHPHAAQHPGNFRTWDSASKKNK